MNPQESLPLRDIHLPEAVSWWPPAIGWWVCLLLLALLSVVLFTLYRYRKSSSLNKRVREEISAISEDYQDHLDGHRLIRDLSIFFRRVGISYLTREQAAGELGPSW